MPTTDRTPRARRSVVPAATAGVVLACATVWTTSGGAWTTGAANGPSTWTAGSVTFGANQPATALINITDVFPGSFGSACVLLTYTGSLTAPAHLYLAAADLTGTGLAAYLSLQVREGTGTAANCSDFNSSGTLYNPSGLTATSFTLSAFSAFADDYATGVGSWIASPADPTRTYRFDWQVQDKNAAESLTAAATFTWEARNN